MSDSNEMADNEITLDQRVVATYTAPAKFEWPSSRASEAGLDESRLKDAAEYASANGSDSLLVLRNGQCVFEQYWNGKTADDLQQTTPVRSPCFPCWSVVASKLDTYRDWTNQCGISYRRFQKNRFRSRLATRWR